MKEKFEKRILSVTSAYQKKKFVTDQKGTKSTKKGR